jgi:hypothetical protein
MTPRRRIPDGYGMAFLTVALIGTLVLFAAWQQ